MSGTFGHEVRSIATPVFIQTLLRDIRHRVTRAIACGPPRCDVRQILTPIARSSPVSARLRSHLNARPRRGLAAAGIGALAFGLIGAALPAALAAPASAATTGAVGSYVPDASTTGVPSGVVLKKYDGDLTISTPGAVIDGLDINGFVKVTAPNVTIKNSIIRGKATTKTAPLLTSASSTASVTIQDSELFAQVPSGWIDGIRGYNITAKRVNIHDVIDAMHIYGDNVTLEASYLHDNVHFESDPNQGGTPSHDDSIQIQKGNNIRIVGNNISGAFNTGVQFTQDQGIVSNVTVDKNKLDGGGCTINLAEKGKGAFQGVKITNNTFGRTTKIANCAIISPITTTLATSNNVFVDGLTAAVRKG